MHDYDDVRFWYVFRVFSSIRSFIQPNDFDFRRVRRTDSFSPPISPEAALAEAERELEYRVQSKDGASFQPNTQLSQ